MSHVKQALDSSITTDINWHHITTDTFAKLYDSDEGLNSHKKLNYQHSKDGTLTYCHDAVLRPWHTTHLTVPWSLIPTTIPPAMPHMHGRRHNLEVRDQVPIVPLLLGIVSGSQAPSVPASKKLEVQSRV